MLECMNALDALKSWLNSSHTSAIYFQFSLIKSKYFLRHKFAVTAHSQHIFPVQLRVLILRGSTFRSKCRDLGARLGNHRYLPQGMPSACRYLLQQPCSCPPLQHGKGAVGRGLLLPFVFCFTGSPTMKMPSKLALRKTKRPFTKSYIFIYGPIPTLKQQAGEVYNQEESQKLQDCRPVIVI